VVLNNVSNNSSHRNYTTYPYIEWAGTNLNKSLVGVMCCLSVLGSLTIFASYVSWKDIRTTSRKILLFLSISDFMIAASNLVGVLFPKNDNLSNPRNYYCVAQSFVTTSSSITSFMWTVTLAIYLYLAIVKSKQNLGRKLMPLFHIVNWLLGPIINAVALSKKRLGYATIPVSGGWCWIYHDPSKDTNTHYVLSDKEKFWIIIDGKGIEITVYTTICVIYGIIKYKLEKEVRQQQRFMDPEMCKLAKGADHKLILVPFLLVLGRSFGIIRFFIYMTSEPKLVVRLYWWEKALLTLQGIGDSSQGFLNCVLFCFFNPKVYANIKGAFRYYVCCGWCSFGDSETCWNGSLNNDPHTFVSNADTRPLIDGGYPTKHYGSQWK